MDVLIVFTNQNRALCYDTNVVCAVPEEQLTPTTSTWKARRLPNKTMSLSIGRNMLTSHVNGALSCQSLYEGVDKKEQAAQEWVLEKGCFLKSCLTGAYLAFSPCNDQKTLTTSDTIKAKVQLCFVPVSSLLEMIRGKQTLLYFFKSNGVVLSYYDVQNPNEKPIKSFSIADVARCNLDVETMQISLSFRVNGKSACLFLKAQRVKDFESWCKHLKYWLTTRVRLSVHPTPCDYCTTTNTTKKFIFSELFKSSSSKMKKKNKTRSTRTQSLTNISQQDMDTIEHEHKRVDDTQQLENREHLTVKGRKRTSSDYGTFDL